MTRAPSFATALLLASLALGPAGCEQKGGPLRVESAEPAEGTTAGGDQITLSGGGFVPGKTQATVFIGRRRAETVVIASSNKISVVTPPGDKGPTDVTVNFDTGESFKIPSGFKYVPPAAAANVREAFLKQAGSNK